MEYHLIIFWFNVCNITILCFNVCNITLLFINLVSMYSKHSQITDHKRRWRRDLWEHVFNVTNTKFCDVERLANHIVCFWWSNHLNLNLMHSNKWNILKSRGKSTIFSGFCPWTLRIFRRSEENRETWSWWIKVMQLELPEPTTYLIRTSTKKSSLGVH